MTEVRTTSSTGGQKGVKPERYDLLPKEALDAMARVYAFGAEKYADHNWRKGYEWSKSFAAAMRHMWAFWNGETYDEESGLPHLAHAAFHLNAMLTWLERDGEGGQFDDRWINSPALQGVKQEDIDAVAESFTRKYGAPPTPPAPFVEAFVHPDDKVTLASEPSNGAVTMPSETAKKLGIDRGIVQHNIQMHFNGGPDQGAVAREINQAITDLRAAERNSTIRLD